MQDAVLIKISWGKKFQLGFLTGPNFSKWVFGVSEINT